jgi:hypothetical protein
MVNGVMKKVPQYVLYHPRYAQLYKKYWPVCRYIGVCILVAKAWCDIYYIFFAIAKVKKKAREKQAMQLIWKCFCQSRRAAFNAGTYTGHK